MGSPCLYFMYTTTGIVPPKKKLDSNKPLTIDQHTISYLGSRNIK